MNHEPLKAAGRALTTEDSMKKLIEKLRDSAHWQMIEGNGDDEIHRNLIAGADALERLTAERDAALVDAKRMDWLEAHKRPAEIYVDGVPHGCNHYGIAAATNLTLRAAIDAAMEKTK